MYYLLGLAADVAVLVGVLGIKELVDETKFPLPIRNIKRYVKKKVVCKEIKR